MYQYPERSPYIRKSNEKSKQTTYKIQSADEYIFILSPTSYVPMFILSSCMSRRALASSLMSGQIIRTEHLETACRNLDDRGGTTLLFLGFPVLFALDFYFPNGIPSSDHLFRIMFNITHLI